MLLSDVTLKRHAFSRGDAAQLTPAHAATIDHDQAMWSICGLSRDAIDVRCTSS